MVPTFYDSIEIMRENLAIKFQRRMAYWGARAGGLGLPLAVLITFVEIVLFLVLVRFVYRMVMMAARMVINGTRKAPPDDHGDFTKKVA